MTRERAVAAGAPDEIVGSNLMRRLYDIDAPTLRASSGNEQHRTTLRRVNLADRGTAIMSGEKVIHMRRVFGDTEPDDGSRVLVDRMWPRGLSKKAANLDSWLKAVAPSDELRRWYGHDPKRYSEFAQRYRTELEDGTHREAINEILSMATHGPVTLLTATKNVGASHVPILLDALTESTW